MDNEKNSTQKLIDEIKKKGGISSIILNYLGLQNFSIKDSALILSNYGWYLPGNFELKKKQLS